MAQSAGLRFLGRLALRGVVAAVVAFTSVTAPAGAGGPVIRDTFSSGGQTSPCTGVGEDDWALSVSVVGSGSVTVTPPAATVTNGQVQYFCYNASSTQRVTLEPHPDGGHSFYKWRGGVCNNLQGTCTIDVKAPYGFPYGGSNGTTFNADADFDCDRAVYTFNQGCPQQPSVTTPSEVTAVRLPARYPSGLSRLGRLW